MAEGLPRIDVFAEDYAHEQFIRAMLIRLSRAQGMRIDIRTISAQGGHGRVLAELRLYRASLARGFVDRQPDGIIIASDSNCSPYSTTRGKLADAAGPELLSRAVIACPNPHVERWYMADPPSFSEVVGKQPRLGKRKCDRDRYKAILSKVVSDAGHPPTLGGIEFGPDIVSAMDLYRAGKNEGSLKHFVDQADGLLRRLSGHGHEVHT